MVACHKYDLRAAEACGMKTAFRRAAVRVRARWQARLRAGAGLRHQRARFPRPRRPARRLRGAPVTAGLVRLVPAIRTGTRRSIRAWRRRGERGWPGQARPSTAGRHPLRDTSGTPRPRWADAGRRRRARPPPPGRRRGTAGRSRRASPPSHPGSHAARRDRPPRRRICCPSRGSSRPAALRPGSPRGASSSTCQ